MSQITNDNGSSGALSDKAYQSIRQMVLEYAIPRGKRISEMKLGQQLGISRTPVREAIQRLAREGLLVTRPSSGTYVVEPASHEVHDIYEVRLAIESMTAAKAARRMKPADIRQMQKYVKQMRNAIHAFRKTGDSVITGKLLLDFHTADQAFHDLILQVSGNDFAKTIVSQAHVRQYVFGQQSHHRDLHHLSQVLLFHTRIARAIAKRDARRSKQMMAKHTRQSMNDALVQIR